MKKFRKYTSPLVAVALVLWACQASAMTEAWSAQATRFLTLSDQVTPEAIGDYIAIGLVTNPAYTASLKLVSPAAVVGSMIIYDSSTIGQGSGVEGSFTVVSGLNGPGFFGQQIYLLAVNAGTVAAATEVGVFTNPSWLFPASDGAAAGSLDVSDAGTYALIGSLANGTVLDPNLGDTSLDAAALAIVGVPLGSIWSGATDLGGGLYYLAWFGYFTPYPPGNWIWHYEHGWLYCVGTSTADLWLWSSRLGWLWTSDSLYPFLWSDTAKAWLWYYKGTGNTAGGWFYNFGTAQVEWK